MVAYKELSNQIPDRALVSMGIWVHRPNAISES